MINGVGSREEEPDGPAAACNLPKGFPGTRFAACCSEAWTRNRGDRGADFSSREERVSYKSELPCSVMGTWRLSRLLGAGGWKTADRSWHWPHVHQPGSRSAKPNVVRQQNAISTTAGMNLRNPVLAKEARHEGTCCVIPLDEALRQAELICDLKKSEEWLLLEGWGEVDLGGWAGRTFQVMNTEL